MASLASWYYPLSDWCCWRTHVCGGGGIDAPDDENEENMPATLKAACDYVRAGNMNIERKHITKQLDAIPDYTCTQRGMAFKNYVSADHWHGSYPCIPIMFPYVFLCSQSHLV